MVGAEHQDQLLSHEFLKAHPSTACLSLFIGQNQHLDLKYL